ncbi:unnamed protein product [[Candida] boidinii]|nr:unnamed protein product [[Candida] boidinii]
MGEDSENLIGGGVSRRLKNKGASRNTGSLAGLAGGEDMAYVEYSRNKNKELNATHPFFQKLYKKRK